MTILDKTHAIRGYYYLDAEDQSIYGTGSSPISALDDFRQALVNSGAKASNTPNSNLKQITGTVDREAIVSNKNKVMFTLKDSQDVYTIDTEDFAKANLLISVEIVSIIANMVNVQYIGK